MMKGKMCPTCGKPMNDQDGDEMKGKPPMMNDKDGDEMVESVYKAPMKKKGGK